MHRLCPVWQANPRLPLELGGIATVTIPSKKVSVGAAASCATIEPGKYLCTRRSRGVICSSRFPSTQYEGPSRTDHIRAHSPNPSNLA